MRALIQAEAPSAQAKRESSCVRKAGSVRQFAAGHAASAGLRENHAAAQATLFDL